MTSRTASAAADRARLLDAMARTAAAKGLAATTVADVVERSGVSRRAFYELFVDKEACFLAAYEATVLAVLEDMAAAATAVPRGRLRAALDAGLAALAAQPDVARLFVVDVLTTGPKALQLRRRLIGRCAERLGALAGRGSNPGDPMLRALAGGMQELVAEHIAEHGAESLPLLAPALERLTRAVLA